MIDHEEMNEQTVPSPEEVTEEAAQTAGAEATSSAEEAEKEKDVKNDKKLKKELSECKEKCEALEKSLAEQQDKYLRLVAEYDNFRRRSQKEKEGIYTDAYTDALKALLPVADNLELAVKYSEGDKVIEGVKMTLTQLSTALEKMGVEVIPTETFDPTVHNAVMHIEDEQYGEGAIVDVLQKGYRKGDKIIRFAMVTVAN